MTIIKTLLTVLILFCVIAFALLFHHHFATILHEIEQLGWLAPVLFVGLYCLATLLFLPTLILTLAGGALFGPFLGTALNLAGAISGAALSFLITHHFVFEKLLQQKNKYVQQLILGVDQKGWLIVAVLRLFPIIPFNLVNYGLGLTSIRFRIYFFTTTVFLIPAEIIYTYCGYAGMDFLQGQGNLYQFVALIGLIVLLCGVAFFKSKSFKKP